MVLTKTTVVVAGKSRKKNCLVGAMKLSILITLANFKHINRKPTDQAVLND